MDIIIVGNGKVGFSLAEQLVREDHNVTVVDTREDSLRRAADQLDVMTIHGNGVSISCLKDAGAADADDFDGDNVLRVFGDCHSIYPPGSYLGFILILLSFYNVFNRRSTALC